MIFEDGIRMMDWIANFDYGFGFDDDDKCKQECRQNFLKRLTLKNWVQNSHEYCKRKDGFIDVSGSKLIEFGVCFSFHLTQALDSKPSVNSSFFFHYTFQRLTVERKVSD